MEGGPAECAEEFELEIRKIFNSCLIVWHYVPPGKVIGRFRARARILRCHGFVFVGLRVRGVVGLWGCRLKIKIERTLPITTQLYLIGNYA